MLWTLFHAIERHLFTAILTVVLVSICVGLSWWIWQDRGNRTVPVASDLIQLQGIASAPHARPRSNSVWFRMQPEPGQADGTPAALDLRVLAKDLTAVESAIAANAAPATAWAVRSELNRGPRAEPASVLQLDLGGKTILPLAVGQEMRTALAANARLNAWIAGAGIAVSLLCLVLHWISKLRS